MRTYNHLTLEEREKLYAMQEKGVSLRAIAQELKRSHTTLSRELKRNAKYGRAYIPCIAHKQTEKRLQRQRQKAALKDLLVFVYVREHLRMRWSPEQIAGRLPLDHPGHSIDDETIYRYIYDPNRRGERFQKYLPLHRLRRMKKFGRKTRRGRSIPGILSIDVRPKEANERTVIGHWETDNMEGIKTDKTVISSTVERVTRMTILMKLYQKTAHEKATGLIERFQHMPSKVRKSLTVDNGLENAHHTIVTKQLHMPVYACHAYHSWEKGTVENMNGRIRRYIPRGVSIDPISKEQVQTIEDSLNNTPRKCLNFKTPYEKMDELLQKD